MRHLTLLVLGSVLLVALPAPARAGELNPEWIAVDAEWLLHVDVEAVVDCPFGQFVIEHADELDLDLEAFEEEFGMDPLENIRSVTLYGRDDPEVDAVVIMVASDAIDEIVEQARQDKEHYRHTTVARHPVHVWDDGDEKVYVHIRPTGDGDRLVVLGKARRQLRRALRVMQGDRDALADAGRGAIRTRPESGSLLFAATGDLPWVEAEDDPASTIIRQARNLVLDIGQTRRSTRATLSVWTRDHETAGEIAEVVEGLIALGNLMAATDSGLADLRTLMDDISVRSDEERITIRIEHATEPLIDQLEGLLEHH